MSDTDRPSGDASQTDAESAPHEPAPSEDQASETELSKRLAEKNAALAAVALSGLEPVARTALDEQAPAAEPIQESEFAADPPPADEPIQESELAAIPPPAEEPIQEPELAVDPPPADEPVQESELAADPPRPAQLAHHHPRTSTLIFGEVIAPQPSAGNDRLAPPTSPSPEAVRQEEVIPPPQESSEPIDLQAPISQQPVARASEAGNAPDALPDSVAPAAFAGLLDSTLPNARRRRRSYLATLAWLGGLCVAFWGGFLTRAAPRSSPSVALPTPSAAPVSSKSTSDADEEPPLELSRPMEQLEKLSPDQRTRVEAVALGRYWAKQQKREFSALAAELRAQPSKLDDPDTRKRILDFVDDGATSQLALDLLSELPNPLALDLLYEVWTGSKERTDSTKLAQAFLMAKDVRPRTSPALDLALTLRDAPTSCDVIARLFDIALKEGDRRSAMLLVRTSGRKNCGDGKQDCMQCLKNARFARKAIRAAASRLPPVP